MGTAIEQYLNQLISMKLLATAFLCDLSGRSIVQCFGPELDVDPGRAGSDEGAHVPQAAQLDNQYVSNVVLSGARTLALLSQLHLGALEVLTAQYHDAMVVQFVEGLCLVTLVGHRSQDHCLGAILSLVPQIRAAPVFREVCAAVKAASE